MLRSIIMTLLLSFGMTTFCLAEDVEFSSFEDTESYDALKQALKHEKKFEYERKGVDVMFEHMSFFESVGSVEEVMIFKAGQAEMLIQKMIQEKKAQDKSLQDAKTVLVLNKLWDGSLDACFNAAWASVTSGAAGGRNFLLPAVWEVIKFSVSKGFQAYNMWDQYNYHLQDARHHAEVFDFYMNTLIKIQGKG